MCRNLLTIIAVLLITIIPAQGQTGQTASETIRFTTAVTDLRNHYHEILSYYQNRPVYMADFNIQILNQNPENAIYFIEPKSPAEDNQIPSQNYLSVKYNTKDFFDKEELTTLISKAESNTERVKKHCLVLSNYFSNKKFVQDASFSKYPALRDSLQASLSIALDSWKKVTDLNSNIQDAAEIQLLQSKKVAPFVVPMKEDADKLKRIIDQVYSQQLSAIILKLDVDDLQAMVDIHKDYSRKDKSKLKDESYLNVYSRFYSATDECIGIVRQILDCIEQKKFDSTLDNLFDKLNEKYSKVQDDYKLFASQD
ncbi:hypothetical protein [Dysgonomonas macrotermitis]|uniref:DUF3829 domain-containing protein n=1 Tax=Dysgonomonas macrotermitis TaxID=1346286 RepID=A0A1M4ZU16_9BACT|nr:hypothetical protein [Dysgonomonas macrotermitis]SHF21529.1 hypothetical protein SAMN05444362_104191 [Dysgonomonas macrotermitis]